MLNPFQILTGLSVVIFSFTKDDVQVLVVHPEHHPFLQKTSAFGFSNRDSLPFGSLLESKERTLEKALRVWVKEQTRLELEYAEQLYTFGDLDRLLEVNEKNIRLVSIVYMALTLDQNKHSSLSSQWKSVYSFFPWEDWRTETPKLIESQLFPQIQQWIQKADNIEEANKRRNRADILFCFSGGAWDEEKVLERYEFLFEMGAVNEAFQSMHSNGSKDSLGIPMALDHRRMVATALSRIRGKMKYRPVVFELLPETFTLFQIQQCVEALSGKKIHKQNFRRDLEKMGLVESTGLKTKETGGRPALLFRFREEVLKERFSPGIGIPQKKTPLSS